MPISVISTIWISKLLLVIDFWFEQCHGKDPRGKDSFRWWWSIQVTSWTYYRQYIQFYCANNFSKAWSNVVIEMSISPHLLFFRLIWVVLYLDVFYVWYKWAIQWLWVNSTWSGLFDSYWKWPISTRTCFDPLPNQPEPSTCQLYKL